MPRFRFELATPDDDVGLRALLSATTMPGKIGLQFLREPSFFAGNCVLGPFHQTIICRDGDTREIVGFGCRSVREMMVDGKQMPVGYLSMLRLKTAFRSIGLISRGYDFLRELHQDGRTEFYLTTIADGNNKAIALLTSGRAGLPNYEFEGRYSTFVFPTKQRDRFAKHDAGLRIRRASENDLDSIIRYLNRQAATRQYFPLYDLTDFDATCGTFRNIAVDNILLAINSRGKIVGIMALWDQRSFRQTTVSSYQGILKHARPVYNAWAHVFGQIKLPKPGQQLQHGFVAIPMIENSNPELFRAMLARLLSMASETGLDYLLFGCHESDPLFPTAREMTQRSYGTRLYRVSWNGAASRPPETTRSPYLELGCL